MNTDPFSSASDSLIAPARIAFVITPEDALDLPSATRAIYVGTGGDLAVQSVGSDAVVILRNVPSGTILPIRAGAVRDTDTTAADLVGLA